MTRQLNIGPKRAKKRHQRAWSLEDMRQIAATHGGECLADTYVSGEIKVPWRCSVGHKWEAPGKSIVKGHWCPVCGREAGAVNRKYPTRETPSGVQEILFCGRNGCQRAIRYQVDDNSGCWNYYSDKIEVLESDRYPTIKYQGLTLPMTKVRGFSDNGS